MNRRTNGRSFGEGRYIAFRLTLINYLIKQLLITSLATLFLSLKRMAESADWKKIYQLKNPNGL